MKIVYIVHDYTNSAGIERVISLKSNYFVNIGYDVHIVSCCHEEKEPFFEFDSRIKFYNLALPSIRVKYKKLFVDRLSLYLKDVKPDITISTGMRVMNYLYEVNDGSKKILETHFSKYRRKFKLAKLENSKLGRILLNAYYFKFNKIVRRYDKFVVLTNEDKKSWLVANIPNIEVIPNPLTFIPEKSSDLKTKRIIAVGRYTYQKGFDQIFDIWHKIESLYPDWILTLYGTGAKGAKLKSKIQSLNLGGRVELRPPVKDISKEFLHSSIFALPSRYEGLPMVLLEAMVCGVPAVCFACKCGPRDVIIDGEDGFYVEMGDEKKFKERLTLLMDDVVIRQKMGKQARENIMFLKEENVMPKWISLFEGLFVP